MHPLNATVAFKGRNGLGEKCCSAFAEGHRPSESPTRSLARRCAGALPPPLKLRRTLRSACGAKEGRSRGSLASLARRIHFGRTMSPDKWKRVAIGMAVLFALVNTANALNKGGDALVFFEGGRRLLQAEPLYEGSSAADGFIGPPFQALFVAPFSAIAAHSVTAARLAWYLFNLACLWFGIVLTLKAWTVARARLGLASIPWL